MSKNVFSVLAGLMIFLYLMSFAIELKNNSVTFIKTAIINPSKAELLKDFNIAQNGNSLKFRKENGIWFCVENDVEYPVEQNQVENFIKSLKNIIKMYKIVYNSDYNSLHFAIKSYFSFSYSFQDDTDANTEIFFGPCDFSNTKRIVKIPSLNSYFKTEDVFGNFLSTDLNFWIDPYFIPKSLFQIGEGKNTESEISRIIYVTENQSKVLEKNSDPEAMKKMLSLRHGKIFSGNHEELKKIGMIRVESDYAEKLDIHVLEDGKGDFVLNYKNDFFDYSVCVSEWTFSNLSRLFS